MERPVLDIEAALKNDPSGEYKRTLIGELLGQANGIKSELNKGVGPDDYKRLQALLQATETASEVVEKVWQQIHIH